jgi:hypothetical protein
VEPIAKQINDALMGIYTTEIHIIAGRHIQRDQESGLFRFLPGKTRQTLLNDIGTFGSHFVDCCRGIGFTACVSETASKGVEVKIQGNINPVLGRNLVDR